MRGLLKERIVSETVTQRPMTTTLARIKAHNPCTDGWRKLLRHLGKTEADDEPLPYAVILESNGLDDALWACRAEPRYNREWRLYAVWCAEQVSHLLTDPRSHAASQVARRFANGKATREELDAARDAAWAAAGAARATVAAAGAARATVAAAWAAARDASRAAARAAVWAARAAGDAAWAAARAAGDAAWAAAWAARNASGDAVGAAQKAEFLRVVGSTGGDHE